MIPYTIASPSPVPFPTPLVVKNGSNILSFVFSSIPSPVSETDTRAYRPTLPYPCVFINLLSTSAMSVIIPKNPPLGHGIPCICGKVHQHLFHLANVCHQDTLFIGKSGLDFNILSHNSYEKAFNSFYNFIQIYRTWIAYLFPAKGKEALG